MFKLGTGENCLNCLNAVIQICKCMCSVIVFSVYAVHDYFLYVVDILLHTLYIFFFIAVEMTKAKIKWLPNGYKRNRGLFEVGRVGQGGMILWE